MGTPGIFASSSRVCAETEESLFVTLCLSSPELQKSQESQEKGNSKVIREGIEAVPSTHTSVARENNKMEHLPHISEIKKLYMHQARLVRSDQKKNSASGET